MSKRFWGASCAVDHEVRLDLRPLRLPSGAVLRLATTALAEAVAAEWQAVGATFSAADLPMTGLAGAAQERVAPQATAMVETLLCYAQADQLCYRVDQPEALAAAQAAQWQPWLDWAARHHGAPLHVTTSIVQIDQPPESLAALASALARLNAEELAGLGVIIPGLGSCVLGLALAAGAIDAVAAAEVAWLDERFQEQRWGVDADAAARRDRLRAEIAVAARFMELSRVSDEGSA